MLTPSSARGFEVLDCIGRGGIAEVFRAHRFGLHGFRSRVALKVLRPELAHDERHRDRLIHEARLGATLIHPNLVQTLDLVLIDGRLAIVQELIDGFDLHELLAHLTRTGGHIPLSVGIHLALEVLRGLAHAVEIHGSTLVHGDVTPGNIMVSRHGAVRLIDFGVASTTLDSALRGKPGYLSPEVVAGELPDHRSDVFAVAVVLWEMLTLRRLFVAEDDPQTLQNVLNVRIDKRFARSDRVPADLLDLLRKALSRVPADRFESAEAFAAALSDWADERGLSCAREGLLAFLAKSAPRRPQPSVLSDEPPPLPAASFDFSGLEDAIAEIDAEPIATSFTALARGHLDDRFARLADATQVAPHERSYVPLGSLDPITLPAVLATLARTRQTGALTVVDRHRRKLLFFEEGALVQVSSNIEAELLGRRLIQASAVAAPVAEKAMALARARGIRIGEALLELRATTPARLANALEQQLAARFTGLLSWTEGRLTFERNRRVEDRDPNSHLRLAPLELLWRGLRETWVDTRLGELLEPLASDKIHWTTPAELVARDLELDGVEEASLLSFESGERVGALARDGRPMRFLLVALIALGFLRVASP